MKILLLLFGFLVSQTVSSPIFQNAGTGMFGNNYQGDIKLTKAQKLILLDNNARNQSTKTGWTWEGFRWPKNSDGLVIVPYSINYADGFSQREIELMHKELTIIEHVTCIRFVQRTTEDDYIDIVDGDGCWSWLGRIGGRQELSMDRSGCFEQGIPVHEMFHALGYDHMHNHIDRDDYVEIYWENVSTDMQSNFEKVDPEWFSNFDTPYDLMSVMHYPRWAFSYNGEDVIVPLNSYYIDKIGSPHMSDNDALRLNRMYNCD